MKHKVQISPSHAAAARWRTVATCQSMQHAEFVLAGLLAGRTDRKGRIISAK